MSNNSAAYNLGPAGMIDLETWLEGPSPRCLFAQLPLTLRIGEDEFLLDVARDRKKRLGFKDALGRHFVSRRFSANGSTTEANMLLSRARVAAEITDEFFGVDAIDLSEWVNVAKSGERWQALVRHIQTSPHTDFVFLVRTADEKGMQELADAVTKGGCLLADTVRLYPPTGAMLAETLLDNATEDLEAASELARDIFEAMLACGGEPNYTLAIDLASKASIEVRHGLGPEDAVTVAFASRGISQTNRR